MRPRAGPSQGRAPKWSRARACARARLPLGVSGEHPPLDCRWRSRCACRLHGPHAGCLHFAGGYKLAHVARDGVCVSCLSVWMSVRVPRVSVGICVPCVPVYNYIRVLQSRRVGGAAAPRGRAGSRPRRGRHRTPRAAARRRPPRARARGGLPETMPKTLRRRSREPCTVRTGVSPFCVLNNISSFITHATSRPTNRGRTARRPPARAAAEMRQTQVQTLEHMHIRSYKPTLGPRENQDRWLPLVLLAVL